MNTQKNPSSEDFIGKIFLKKYTVQKKIGEGSFGMLYKATSSEGDFAIKFEKRTKNNLLLEGEAQILNYLRGPGVPLFKAYSSSGGYNILVMQLLGKSLEQLLQSTQMAQFSIRTVCNIAIQILKTLRKIHDKHLIHRDIKPDNFVIGLNNESNKVFIIDFGLAKKYRSSTTFEQYPMKTGKKLTGTARYASINALSGIEQSRRDDLESVAYMLVYLLKGSLPWQGLPVKKKEDRYQRIMEKKKATSPSELCKGLPKEFHEFIAYTRGLSYAEPPKYSFLIELMKKVLRNEGVEFDFYCDWCKGEEKKESEGNNNITAFNTIYQQVNNITINETTNNFNKTNAKQNNFSKEKNLQLEGNKNFYNEEHRNKSSIEPNHSQIVGKKFDFNQNEEKCDVHVESAPVYKKVINTESRVSQCCLM